MPNRVRVKVCGVTCVADAHTTANAGADWLGLNFHPGSPRHIDTDTARSIVHALTLHHGTSAVGVFVGRDPAEVAAVAERAFLGIVQLHGTEPPSDVAFLQAVGLSVVKALRLGSTEDLAAARKWLEAAASIDALPDFLLLDAAAPGTGQVIPEAIGAEIPALVSRWQALAGGGTGWILAGGLTPENVAGRVRRLRPAMVDVASGVESTPGRKDPARLAAFVANAQAGDTAPP